VRGKIALVGMLIVAGGLAIFGWWWRYEQANQASEFWGRNHIQTLLNPGTTEVFFITKPDESSEHERISFRNQAWQLGTPRVLTQARGFLHARHSLTQDVSFDWERATDQLTPHWQMGVRLSHAGQTTTLLFDFDQQLLGVLELDKIVSLSPHTSTGWQSYLQRITASHPQKNP
jgi:hypothetical protein